MLIKEVERFEQRLFEGPRSAGNIRTHLWAFWQYTCLVTFSTRISRLPTQHITFVSTDLLSTTNLWVDLSLYAATAQWHIFGSYEVESDMTGSTMFWRSFTNLNIWSGEFFIQVQPPIAALKNTDVQLRITGIISSQFLQYFSGHMHTLCAYFFYNVTCLSRKRLPSIMLQN